MQVNLAADATPLERTAVIAPREGKVKPFAAAGRVRITASLPSHSKSKVFIGDSMTEKNRQVTKNSWEIVQVEYQAAMEQYRHYTVLRRQDMAFVTTVQVAILTIIGAKAQSLDFSGFLLSLMAFFVLLLGINSELRLATYMSGYKQRAKDIEEENRLNLVTGASKRVEQMEKNMFNMTNRKIFPLYYFVFALIWIAVWLANVY